MKPAVDLEGPMCNWSGGPNNDLHFTIKSFGKPGAIYMFIH